MMNYFTIGYPQRQSNYMGPGNANPIYTTIFPDDGPDFATSGYFVWTKSSVGYPWDVDTFDENYIYNRTTELSWTDPTSFKRFTTDLPFSHRCVGVDEAGSQINVAAAHTTYNSYENCEITQTQPLGYAATEISAAAMLNTGGNLGTVKTRKLTYRYTCNSKYVDCTYKEVFSLGYEVGLYDWKYYVKNGSTWTLSQESIINEFDTGTVTPYLPCSNSY
jgi:hypothetical protein